MLASNCNLGRCWWADLLANHETQSSLTVSGCEGTFGLLIVQISCCITLFPTVHICQEGYSLYTIWSHFQANVVKKASRKWSSVLTSFFFQSSYMLIKMHVGLGCRSVTLPRLKISLALKLNIKVLIENLFIFCFIKL